MDAKGFLECISNPDTAKFSEKSGLENMQNAPADEFFKHFDPYRLRRFIELPPDFGWTGIKPDRFFVTEKNLKNMQKVKGYQRRSFLHDMRQLGFKTEYIPHTEEAPVGFWKIYI